MGRSSAANSYFLRRVGAAYGRWAALSEPPLQPPTGSAWDNWGAARYRSGEAMGSRSNLPAATQEPATEAAWASHDVLFEADEAVRCDACGGSVVEDQDVGRGVYVWTRGDEVRLEHVPLCSSCAAAIGVAALGRWEIEEEEG